MNLSLRIQRLLERCLDEDVGSDTFAEWQELTSAARSDASFLGNVDLEKLHLAGYYLFDRSGRSGLALEELESSLSLSEDKSLAAEFHNTDQLLNYAAHFAKDEAKTLTYLNKLILLKLRSREHRHIRAGALSALLEPECHIKLPEELITRIVDVVNSDK